MVISLNKSRGCRVWASARALPLLSVGSLLFIISIFARADSGSHRHFFAEEGISLSQVKCVDSSRNSEASMKGALNQLGSGSLDVPCKGSVCFDPRAASEAQKLRILYLWNVLGINAFHGGYSNARPWSADELDLIIETVSLLPDSLLKKIRGASFVRFNTREANMPVAPGKTQVITPQAWTLLKTVRVHSRFEEASREKKKTILFHELGHVVANSLTLPESSGRGRSQQVDLDRSQAWLSAAGWKNYWKVSRPGIAASGYAISKSGSAGEDLAESFLRFRMAPQDFLNDLRGDRAKYDFMRDVVFDGIEYRGEDQCRKANSRLPVPRLADGGSQLSSGSAASSTAAALVDSDPTPKVATPSAIQSVASQPKEAIHWKAPLPARLREEVEKVSFQKGNIPVEQGEAGRIFAQAAETPLTSLGLQCSDPLSAVFSGSVDREKAESYIKAQGQLALYRVTWASLALQGKPTESIEGTIDSLLAARDPAVHKEFLMRSVRLSDRPWILSVDELMHQGWKKLGVTSSKTRYLPVEADIKALALLADAEEASGGATSGKAKDFLQRLTGSNLQQNVLNEVGSLAASTEGYWKQKGCLKNGAPVECQEEKREAPVVGVHRLRSEAEQMQELMMAIASKAEPRK